MPLRINEEPDPGNPRYRDLERRINLALHTSLFAACNSGLWFAQQLQPRWHHLGLFTAAWSLALLLHLLIVLRLRVPARKS
ncbi:MAG: hypothetical protein ERJ67_03585 [Aphanocapsa feldmannii 277cV]|uniref:2TM domain-containing protein n=2 Tax=Aphanocapsa feldmannii TaxID=192050 RepID=A0A524RPI5_9CHRO|nr:MAG: hypothetical protein ERJ69_08505 [Aphanocapsa feldmannii 288cV]TGG93731.1 MAG: hypothetical protein ERJ67_03585 [Aphanocapsa feldmannii 277cV]TGH27604.1 MAG: hypothetical protein ERJ68_00810 [Aphanocapsa feldmannii 277cI]